GELGARRHTDAAGLSIAVNEVDARYLRFFATVIGMRGYVERLIVSPKHRARPFVKPLWRSADLAGCRLAAFDTPLVHTHAVRDLLARRVHRLAIGSTPD